MRTKLILGREGCNASKFLLLIFNYVQYVNYVNIVQILFSYTCVLYIIIIIMFWVIIRGLSHLVVFAPKKRNGKKSQKGGLTKKGRRKEKKKGFLNHVKEEKRGRGFSAFFPQTRTHAYTEGRRRRRRIWRRRRGGGGGGRDEKKFGFDFDFKLR